MQRKPGAVLVPDLYVAPESIHATRDGDLIYTAGLTARERNGSISAKGDLRAQAEKVYADLGVVLKAAGASWENVVKLNYYVSPRACSGADRATLRNVEGRHVPEQHCAASGISVEMDDPDLLIQIEAIASLAQDRRVIAGIPGLPSLPGRAQAVRTGSTLYVGAQLPFDAVQSAKNPIPLAESLGEQTYVAYGHFAKILEAAGMGWDDVVQVHQFMTPPRLTIDEFQKARTSFLTLGRFLSTSVRSAAEHPDWPMQGWQISVDMEADLRPRRPVQPKDAWGNPPGPHAFVTGSLMRMHGQVSRNLELQTIHENDPARQAEVVYGNIDKILKAASSGWERVLHVRNFCKRRQDLAAVKSVRNRFLAERVPNTDLVADFFDPKLLLEVEVVAQAD